MAHEARQAESGHLDHYWPCKLVAWAAGITGILFAVGATSHLVAVVAVALHQHKPFDFRLVSLIATGGILLYLGLLNLGISKWIARGRQWAFAMSAFGTIALLVYAILLLFMKTPPDSTDPFAGAGDTARSLTTIIGIYLAILMAGWISLRRKQAGRQTMGGA